MQRLKSFEDENRGTLFLVATPIGNLSEISERTKEILGGADLIACEDTRVSGKLLSYLGISKPLISHHEHNERKASAQILSALEEGKKVAVVSDAGYPLISDPGNYLVSQVLERDFPIVPVSGANAAVNALVASGLPADHYLFYGFLEAKSSHRKKELEKLAEFPYTIIFYEAPHRIEAMLTDLLEVLGDRKICLCRELTKRYEEFIHGTVSEVISVAGDLKGEMVVLVEGFKEEKNLQAACKKVRELMDQGIRIKEACKQVAKETGLSKNELYQMALDARDEEI